MVNGGSERIQRLDMRRYAVTHVALEAVAGMGKPEPGHQPIPRDLGDDGSGSDRQDQRVTGDHRFAVAAAVDLHVAIDEDEFEA